MHKCKSGTILDGWKKTDLPKKHARFNGYGRMQWRHGHNAVLGGHRRLDKWAKQIMTRVNFSQHSIDR